MLIPTYVKRKQEIAALFGTRKLSKIEETKRQRSFLYKEKERQTRGYKKSYSCLFRMLHVLQASKKDIKTHEAFSFIICQSPTRDGGGGSAKTQNIRLRSSTFWICPSLEFNCLSLAKTEPYTIDLLTSHCQSRLPKPNIVDVDWKRATTL